MKDLEPLLKMDFDKKSIPYKNLYIELSEKEFLEELIKTKEDNIWEIYNFYIILTNLYSYFEWESSNIIEEKILEKTSEIEKKWYKIKRFQLLVEDLINEMIKKDIDIQTNITPYVSINLDNLYKIDLTLDQGSAYEHLLPRTKDPLLKHIIINNNLILANISNFKEIFFFNKIKYKNMSLEEKKNLPDIIENIIYTKGYVMLIKPKIVDVLKKLIYRRKIVKFNKTQITPINIRTVSESLKNEKYSSPIWMKSLNITKVKSLETCDIYNDIRQDPFNPKLLTEPLNYLNRIEMIGDLKTFDFIYKMAEERKLLENAILTKNVLKNDIYGIGSESKCEITIDPEKYNSVHDETSLVQSAAFLELIKTQYYRFSSFFFEHRYDSRTRIYNYNYPLNYQLSHLVRLTIKFKYNSKKEEITEIIKKIYEQDFFKLNDINLLDLKIFHYQKLNKVEDIIEKLQEIGLNLNYTKSVLYEDIASNMKLEGVLTILEKMAPKRLIGLEKKIEYVLKHLKDFLNADLNDELNLRKFLTLFEFKNKKTIYLLQYHIVLKNIKLNKYDNIIWVDASSNGIQLITLRLGKVKERFLLQVTNIIDNKTEYGDIYSYITEMIKKYDHTEFISKNLKNKIKVKELISLQDDSTNKNIIMPGGYGKGKSSARKDIQYATTIQQNINVWNVLEKKEQDKISDYFWDLNFKFLKELGFDLEKYKKLCINKENVNEKTFCWYSDSNLPIAPINIYKTKRHKILSDIENLKMKKRETSDIDQIKEIEEYIKKKKEILYKDEKVYYKRTVIKTSKLYAKIRIPFTEIKINKRETNQAIMPNAIHSYDAANMIKTLALMDKMGIKGLSIFDSIGCEIRLTPLVKILFKIANIKNIENSIWEPKFPFKEKTIFLEKNERLELYKEILESTFFIK